MDDPENINVLALDLSRPAPCLTCGAKLTPIHEGSTTPFGGTVFVTHGNYGSTVFDEPMWKGGAHARRLVIVICDNCLRAAAMEYPGVIRLHTPQYVSQPEPIVTVWDPDED